MTLHFNTDLGAYFDFASGFYSKSRYKVATFQLFHHLTRISSAETQKAFNRRCALAPLVEVIASTDVLVLDDAVIRNCFTAENRHKNERKMGERKARETERKGDVMHPQK